MYANFYPRENLISLGRFLLLTNNLFYIYDFYKHLGSKISCIYCIVKINQPFIKYSRHLLFGSKGIDLQQISQKLETLSSKRTFEPLQPIADSDVESFLRNERENSILVLIEDVNKNVSTLNYSG